MWFYPLLQEFPWWWYNFYLLTVQGKKRILKEVDPGRALSSVVSVTVPMLTEMPFSILSHILRLWRVNGPLRSWETREHFEQSLEWDPALWFTELHLSYLLHSLLKGNPKLGPLTILVVTLLQEHFVKQFDLVPTSVLASDSLALRLEIRALATRHPWFMSCRWPKHGCVSAGHDACNH